MTILLKVMPKEFIKDLRDIYNKSTITKYYDFEQALHDEIYNKKLDEDMAKGGDIEELRVGNAESESASARPMHHEEDAWHETYVWVEELGNWVCGLA